MTFPIIDDIPQPPNRANDGQQVFSNKVDATLGQLPTFVTQTNEAGHYIEDKAALTELKAGEASQSAKDAEASNQSAQNAAAVTGYKGEWSPGVTVEIGDIWGYQGSEWRSKTGISVEPTEGEDWRKSINNQDLITVREDILGKNAKVYMGSNGNYAIVGDVIPPETTHIRLLDSDDFGIAFLQNGYENFSGEILSISSNEIALTNGEVSKLHFDVVAPTQYTLRGYSEGVDVFLLYGQSNTVGYADNTEGFPENAYSTKYWRYDTLALEDVASGMRYSSGNISTGHAWMEFANAYTSKTGRKCILIPCAKGESSISDLSKGSATYSLMAQSISDFEDYAALNGVVINSRSLIFHQGETDMIIGTSHNDYIVGLDNLLRDVRIDFNVNKTYIARVGCPQNRTEQSWYAIQSAQDFITQSYDWVVMAYTGCGMFTIGNGMLREGVHYTQLGYNFMGGAIADTVASDIVNPTPASNPEQNQYGGLMTTPDQIWRHTYAHCSYELATGWVLSNVSDTSQPNRSVNVEKIEDLGDRLRVFVQSRGDYIIDINVNVNVAAERYGLRVAVEPVIATTNVRAFDLYFYKDINFLVSMATGGIVPPPDASGGSPFLARVTSEFIDANTWRINHPSSEAFPLITPVYSSSVDDAGARPVFITLNSATSFIIKSYSPTVAKAYCSVPNALMRTSEIIDGIKVSVSAIVAAKKL